MAVVRAYNFTILEKSVGSDLRGRGLTFGIEIAVCSSSVEQSARSTIPEEGIVAYDYLLKSSEDQTVIGGGSISTNENDHTVTITFRKGGNLVNPIIIDDTSKMNVRSVSGILIKAVTDSSIMNLDVFISDSGEILGTASLEDDMGNNYSGTIVGA